MTDKHKNIGLIIGFLLLFIISYIFSIQKTIDLKARLKVLKKEKELLSNASERIFNLQQENKYLDSILKRKELSIENSFQQLLLNKLNNFKKETSIEIISFNEPHQIIKNNTNLLTYSFEIRGGFNALLKLTNFLEKQQLGKLVSVNFEKKKNYRTNREELTGQFYLQKLEQQN
ncbi:hypothetical protein [Polaribacter sp. Asnod1-A03]|uniref:hypothetical protein n=1 Tax=Polaribacter sp. Asnod1-A03 TaxID=3160581 RepID=UPI003866ED2E